MGNIDNNNPFYMFKKDSAFSPMNLNSSLQSKNETSNDFNKIKNPK